MASRRRMDGCLDVEFSGNQKDAPHRHANVSHKFSVRGAFVQMGPMTSQRPLAFAALQCRISLDGLMAMAILCQQKSVAQRNEEGSRPWPGDNSVQFG